MDVRLRDIVYPSNLLSVSRVVLVIPVTFLMRHPPGTADAAIVTLLVVACLTDYVDGMLARRLGQVSDLGRIIDPVADKVAMAIVGVALISYRGFPVPLVGLLIYRDVMIVTGSALVARKVTSPPEANVWGKVNTVLCGLAGVVYLIAPNAFFTTSLVGACYASVLFSGVVYYRLLESVLGVGHGTIWLIRAGMAALTAAVVVGLSRWPFF